MVEDNKRQVIQLDFSKNDEIETNLYKKLKKFRKPQVIVKEILLGNLNISILNNDEEK